MEGLRSLFDLIKEGHVALVDTIEVPDGIRMTAKESKGTLTFETEPITDSPPFWSYHIDPDNRISLT